MEIISINCTFYKLLGYKLQISQHLVAPGLSIHVLQQFCGVLSRLKTENTIAATGKVVNFCGVQLIFGPLQGSYYLKAQKCTSPLIQLQHTWHTSECRHFLSVVTGIYKTNHNCTDFPALTTRKWSFPPARAHEVTNPRKAIQYLCFHLKSDKENILSNFFLIVFKAIST